MTSAEVVGEALPAHTEPHQQRLPLPPRRPHRIASEKEAVQTAQRLADDFARNAAQRDRERSQMEGRIAAQMERSNSLMEAMKTLMESVVASNEVLHSDLAHSQARSQGMAQKVDHICDRVDLLYDKESNN